jgi:ribosomal-protein-alanine N-acetyltransferase
MLSFAPQPDNRPTVEAVRLVLRPRRMEDAEIVTVLLNDRAIPDTAMYFPHPFPLSLAQERIAKDPEKFRDGISVDFHVCLKNDSNPIGAVHVDIELEHERAELGYWIGKPHWNHGYATEAVGAALEYSFTHLEVHRIFAWYLCRNTPSRRVMEKIGMTPEGILREHIKKWDKFEDVQYFGISREEFQAKKRL